MEMIQQLDAQIILWIQEHVVCDGLNAPMLFISKMGNAGWFWILLGILMLLYGIKNRKFARCGLTLLLCLGTTALVCNVTLKPMVGRMRPYDLLGFSILVPPLADFSFPSGHTSSSVAAATAIYAMNRKWGIVAYVFAVLMGISRLYLGVHFPTDVLAGAVIGFVMARLTLWILGKINASFQFQNR